MRYVCFSPALQYVSNNDSSLVSFSNLFQTVSNTRSPEKKIEAVEMKMPCFSPGIIQRNRVRNQDHENVKKIR